MIRLAIVVEGRTEEEFVKVVIYPHLQQIGVYPQPIPLGGQVYMQGLVTQMGNLCWNFDWVTSLVDFYGFTRKKDQTVEQLEKSILQGTTDRINRSGSPGRVLPYIQRHEFEALLFSNPSAFAIIPDAPKDCVQKLEVVCSQFSTPEDIDDSPETAPSKRIAKAIPRYEKVVHGILVAETIGLETIRAQCLRFNQWVSHLESLGQSNAVNPPQE